MSDQYEAGWYPSPISLPEATSGDAQIKHRIYPVGTKLSVVGMRQALLRGMRSAQAVLPEPLLVHELSHKGHGVWMTDLPEELNQIEEMLFDVQPIGRVLIAGLGLGILAQRVMDQDGVIGATVIEIDQHVINLVADNAPYDVVCSDIMEYLRTTDERFDYYLLDTWQGTNELTWWEQVMPMRRLIRQRVGPLPVVHGWAEDIMQGQIFRNLTNCQPHWYTKYLPVPMPEKEAWVFLQDVGEPSWEHKYGEAIDTVIGEMK